MEISKRFLTVSLFANSALVGLIVFNYFVVTPNKINQAKQVYLEKNSLHSTAKSWGRSSRGSEEASELYVFNSLSGLENSELQRIESEVEGYILSSLFRNYPEKGIKVFAGLDPAFKSDQPTMLCNALMERDPMNAMAWLNSEKEDLRPEVYKDRFTSILNFLATSDPDKALSLANTNKENVLGDGVYFSIMAGYASKDINKAIDYMESYESLGLDDNGLFEMYNVMMRRFAESDANHASGLVAQLKSPNLQLRVAPGIADELLATEGIEKSLAWVDTLSSPHAKVQSLERIVTQMDQDQALDYFSKNEGQNDFVSESAQRLAFDRIVTSNPEMAAQLLQQSSNSESPEMATKLIDEWIGRDSDGAVAWVQSLPDSELFDSAASQTAPSLYNNAPLESARLIQRIRDSEMRMEALEGFARLAPVASIPETFGLFQGVVTSEEYRKFSDIYAGRIQDAVSQLPTP